MGGFRRLRPSDFGPSFAFELTRTIVDEALFRRLFNETFAPWARRTPRPHVQWEQLRSKGRFRQPFDAGPFTPWGDLHVNVEVPRHVSRTDDADGRWSMEMFDGLANETGYHYAVIHLFKDRKDPMLNLTSREKIAPETLRQRREIFFGILKTWIRELRAHFVWGDGEFTTVKKHEAEDSRLRVWGYTFYSPRLADAIGRDRFRTLADAGAWSVEDFEGGVLLLGHPDPLTVPGTEKAKATRVLQLRERLGPLLPPKLPPPDPDPREPPPKGVVE